MRTDISNVRRLRAYDKKCVCVCETSQVKCVYCFINSFSVFFPSALSLRPDNRTICIPLNEHIRHIHTDFS